MGYYSFYLCLQRIIVDCTVFRIELCGHLRYLLLLNGFR